MTEGRALGIGVIGVGAMGCLHVASTAGVPGTRLVGVADTDLATGKRIGDAHGVPHHRSVQELLREPAVEAVIIATPAETHAEIVEQAAAAGKHILCEKPLDCRLAPIDRALREVAQAGVCLQVGFNRRFDRSFQALVEDVDSSCVGKVISIHVVSRDPVLPGPPRLISGMSALFFDTTIHDFDMLRYLTGSEIEMVHAQAASAIHGRAEIDTALLLVRMANGVVATIDNSQAAYGYDQRVEVFGTEGSLSVGNETVSTVFQADASGFHLPPLEYFYPQRYRRSYIDQLNYFVGCVTNSVSPSPSGADGRAATVAALATQRSVDEGRPVRTSEIG